MAQKEERKAGEVHLHIVKQHSGVGGSATGVPPNVYQDVDAAIRLHQVAARNLHGGQQPPQTSYTD
eukprot:8658717-Ditylum_brightwellii.AAC.1